jgi:hypothetical protein
LTRATASAPSAQDCGNHRIRQISPDGDVTTLAGSGQPAHKDGHGRHACFYNPCGIAIDYATNDMLYVADYSNNCVRAVSRSGLVSTLAKDSDTPLDSPYGITVHMERAPNGGAEATIYVSSYHSHSLASISPEGRVSVLAGCGAPRYQDGAGAQAAFHAPNGLACDAEGELYVADSGNHAVRRVGTDGTVETMVGAGAAGPSGLNAPCGLAVCKLPGHGSVLLIADRSNSCIRMLSIDALPPPYISPSTLREDLSALLDCDRDYGSGEAVFEVGGRLLRAPKAVLCARCPHFRAMFGCGMRESRLASGEPVRITDTCYDVYRALLDYLLCDELREALETSVVLELMMLANAYGVTRLEQMCASKLISRLDAENVEAVGHCAQMIGAGYLAREADKFVARCAESVCGDKLCAVSDQRVSMMQC